MDQKDLVQKVWEQASADMRQMDSQRTTLSNIILVLDVALIGVLAKEDAPPYAAFLATVLLLLGVFGVFSIAKYYERYRYYKNRAEVLLRELSSELGKDVPSILQQADESHSRAFPMRVRVKVYRVWYLIHFIASNRSGGMLKRAGKSRPEKTQEKRAFSQCARLQGVVECANFTKISLSPICKVSFFAG